MRDLKQNLSKYLKRAAAGETIRVTERGIPKAVIGPIPGRVRIEEGIAEGWISAPERIATDETETTATSPRRSEVAKIRRASSKRRSADVLSEDRGR